MIDYTLPLDQLPDPLPIEPLRKPFDVTIMPPGSKSITCRAYVLAALAKGESKIIRPLRADDSDYLLQALCTLGAEARWVPGEDHDGEDVYIKGVGGRFPRGGNLYMGDGGAPTRFMIACACLAAEPVVIDASPRMRERPIAEGVEMLRQLGATIEYVEEEGRLPVRVLPVKQVLRSTSWIAKVCLEAAVVMPTFFTWMRQGSWFRRVCAPLHLTVPTTLSSQSVSALFLIAPHLPCGLVTELPDQATSESYVDLTLGVMGDWSCGPVDQWRPRVIYRWKSQELVGREYRIAPDASSAVYWYLATAIIEGASISIPGFGLGLHQPDSAAMFMIRGPSMLKGNSKFKHEKRRRPFECDASDMPDGAVAMAILAAGIRESHGASSGVSENEVAAHKSRITGLTTLRVKESDRIAALANELRKVGCTVETGEDWIEITPPKDPRAEPGAKGIDQKPVVIETYNDHRMAMAFAVLGLVRPGISIRNPACVSKSYPGFWKDFARLYQ